jgi:hypothetical protein
MPMMMYQRSSTRPIQFTHTLAQNRPVELARDSHLVSAGEEQDIGAVEQLERRTGHQFLPCIGPEMFDVLDASVATMSLPS